MKRPLCWALSALAIVAVVGGGLYLSSPAQAGPFPGPSCSNGCPNETTAPVVGRGGTCAFARAMARRQAENLAHQFCTQANGLCTFNLVENSSGCWFNNGRYQVDGHGVFTCDLC